MTYVAKLEDKIKELEPVAKSHDWHDDFTKKYAHHQLCSDSAHREGKRFIHQEGEVMPKNLTDLNMRSAKLIGIDLIDTDFTNTKLNFANLTDANLTDANLTRANLTRANLTRANLTRANLTDANLTRAVLSGVNLTDANLTNAIIDRVSLEEETDKWKNANLTNVRLLEKGAETPLSAEDSAPIIQARFDELSLKNKMSPKKDDFSYLTTGEHWEEQDPKMRIIAQGYAHSVPLGNKVETSKDR